MLHLSVHWPDEYDVRLWPFAMDYAVWLYNHTPQHDGGLAPMELFCGNKMNCEYLRRAKVFGCPTYVLDPKLSDGMKIPKWQPRARMAQFFGFSSHHSSSVGLVRNLRTNFVTPQFHVVYDQEFSTVFGGLQGRMIEQLDVDNFQLFLRSKWATDDHINSLSEWDLEVDGPLPDRAPLWEGDELLPVSQPFCPPTPP